MDKNKVKELLIVILGGPFGIHKFIRGDTTMGAIYLSTLGLFGVGWLIDIICVLTNRPSFITGIVDNRQEIGDSNLLNINGTILNLMDREIYCYANKAYAFEDQMVTTRYVRNNSGFNLRIMDRLSYNTGGGNSRAIRQRERTRYNGMLVMTNKRMIFVSQGKCFDTALDKITAIQETKDGLIVQVGSHAYSLITRNHSQFMKVFFQIRNPLPQE